MVEPQDIDTPQDDPASAVAKDLPTSAESLAADNARLREELRELRGVLNAVPLPLYAKNKQGRYTLYNEAMTTVTGLDTKDRFLNKTVYDVIPPQQAALYQELDDEVLRTGRTRIFDVPFPPFGSTERNVVMVKAPVLDGEQPTGGIVTVLLDVTAQRNAEAALRDSEHRYRTLFDSAPDAIVLADAETGNILDVNPAALELLGRSRNELLGQHQTILHPPEYHEATAQAFQQHVNALRHETRPTSVVIPLRTAQGKNIPTQVISRLFRMDGRLVMLGHFRDISESLQAEAALSESEARYRTLFEAAGDAILLFELVGDTPPEVRLLDANGGAMQVTGLTREAILKRSPFELVSPENAPALAQAVEEFHRSDRVLLEVEVIHRQGGRTPMEILAQGFIFQGRRLGLVIARDISTRKRVSSP